MKRIAILHFAGPPTVGGVEWTMLQHARLMADAGYAVRVIAGAGKPFDARVEVVVVPEIGSRQPDVLAVKKELDAGQVTPRFEALRDRIAVSLRERLADVDILIAHNVFTLHKNLALTAALNRMVSQQTIKLVIGWHHDVAWTNPLYRDQLHGGEPWDLLRRPGPNVRHVTVSQARRSELAQLYGIDASEVEVAPPGVDPAEFFNWQPLTRAIVDRLNLLDADLVLLLPARLTRRKNIELAVRALAELRRQTGLDARLIVTGPPGPHNPANDAYLHSLLALRSELGLDGAAHFLYEFDPGSLTTGPLMADSPISHQSSIISAHLDVSDAVIGDLYTLADALFFPSRQEGFGIPVLEAGLARLPAFCADIPPLRETGDGLAHFFDPNADPKDVAALIAAALESDRPGRLRRRVRHEYTWSRIFRERIKPLLEMT
ncbi:MAG TPA: glycosyltransferase family 4 protein [Anaerolineae bacterium]|nr:glycosyltransferase family 4 protein [Anaerolineae bacterium]